MWNGAYLFIYIVLSNAKLLLLIFFLNSENETITDINKNISMLLWEVEAEKNRSFNELRISKELQSSIPDIPLLSLVEAVKGCVDVVRFQSYWSNRVSVFSLKCKMKFLHFELCYLYIC